MNRLLTKVLRPERGPLLKFWQWLHRWLDPLIARAYLRYIPKNTDVVGIPINVMAGDERQVQARLAQVFDYLSRSPRHLSRMRRTLKLIGVGAPRIKHGRYVPQIKACNLAVHELEVDSIPALAATLVQVATEARLRQVLFDKRDASADEWQRLPLLCSRAAVDFLDRAQIQSGAA